MKEASQRLIDLLNNSDKFNIADLYTITCVDGTVLHYTNIDIPLTIGGVTYTPMVIKRGKVKNSIGTSVDSLDVTINVDINDLVGDVPLIQQFLPGKFDGAILQLDRFYSPVPWDYLANSDVNPNFYWYVD